MQILAIFTPSTARRNLLRAVAFTGCLASFLSVALPVRAQEASIEGKAVAEVRVVDESGKAVTQKIPPLPLEAGKPFDFTAERASLRELYRMGDYANIRVTSAMEPGGLRIDFVVQRNFYNNVIQIVGIKEPPSNPAALAAVRLNLGEAFRESSLREAVARLQNSLRDDGLYEAKVSWKLFPNVNTREMDVTFTVDQGLRARVGAITIDNSTPYTDAQILRRTKISAKNSVTAAGLSRASDRVKKYLVKQGYLGAGALLSAEPTTLRRSACR